MPLSYGVNAVNSGWFSIVYLHKLNNIANGGITRFSHHQVGSQPAKLHPTVYSCSGCLFSSWIFMSFTCCLTTQNC